ncbi:unnamed protein product [Darwinula stevensoni]|uniref:MULE transposase domain-containing protein n=1 Tax=Darwinula stevensoni TaxID=69355 RepID=A0A7R9ACN8_9CRUS|nr:unnamed protein product [Darwinula stevensoni]CAG0900554.1 unnamed protein product [Darwinula stevensoni]
MCLTLRGKKYWKCAEPGCRQTAVTLMDPKIMVKSPSIEHPGHGPSREKIVKEKVAWNVKNAISQHSMASVAAATSASIAGLKAADRGYAPSLNALKQVALRKRTEIPELPPTVADFQVDGSYSCTTEGVDWLIHDHVHNALRMMIFATPKNLEYLHHATTWHGDGTFGIALEHGMTVLLDFNSIHAAVHGRVVPLAYLLLPDKTKQTHTSAFQFIINALSGSSSLQTFCSDFESGVVAAMAYDFPHIRHKACFYHFCQRMWRKIQELGLTQFYRDDDIAIKIRMMTCLAFFPVEDVQKVFAELEATMPSEAKHVVQYFRETYVDGRRRRGRARNGAVYPPQLWNVRGRTLSSEPRTKNNLEAWHRRASSLFGKHIHFYAFLLQCKVEQSVIEHVMVKLEAGHIPGKKKAEIDKNNRILTITRTYGDRCNVFLEKSFL